MRHNPPVEHRPAARRAFGFWICLALVVGNMIGSGVFALPSALAPYGWNVAIAWLVTIGGALCLAFVFARLARGFPKAGGPYAYTREAFGPAAGFAIAWSYWVSVLSANGAIALTTVAYLSHFFPIFAALPSLFAIICVWALTALSCTSLRGPGDLQVVTTILKLVPMAAAMLLIVSILVHHGLAPVAAAGPPVPISLDGVATAAALTLWAMVGFESATIPAEHVENPARNIPRATLWGTLLTGLIYLVTVTGIALLLPRAVAVKSNAPFADFIGGHWGAGLASLGALFAAISTLGALNGWVLLQGELPLAMARDGIFPRWLGKVSRLGTPVRAQIVSSGIVTILLATNRGSTPVGLIVFLALVSTTATLIAYVACAAAALRLQVARRLQRSLLLAGCCVAGLLYAFWAFYGVGWKPTLYGIGLMAAGLLVYLAMRFTRLNQAPAERISPAVEMK
jgi:APA family basic amino acid/polyamine antiporter